MTSLTRLLPAAALCGLALFVTPAWGQTGRETPQIVDVALGPDGTLLGRTLTGAGNGPTTDAEVEITFAGIVIAVATSDESGTFEVRELRGGVHVVKTGSCRQVCRFWAPGSAPPTAVRGIVFVERTRPVSSDTERPTETE